MYRRYHHRPAATTATMVTRGSMIRTIVRPTVPRRCRQPSHRRAVDMTLAKCPAITQSSTPAVIQRKREMSGAYGWILANSCSRLAGSPRRCRATRKVSSSDKLRALRWSISSRRWFSNSRMSAGPSVPPPAKPPRHCSICLSMSDMVSSPTTAARYCVRGSTGCGARPGPGCLPSSTDSTSAPARSRWCPGKPR